MPRITFLQLVRRCAPDDTAPVFDQQLGQLSAALRAVGHTTSLLRLSRFDGAALRHGLEAFRPELVHVVFDGLSVDAARRTLAELRDHHPMPVTVGGATATVMPEQAMSLPGVRAVLLGEADRTLPRCVESMLGGGSLADIEGVWVNEGGRILKRGLPAIVADLDELPMADRSIFAVRESTEVFDITVGRGCPFRCGYCLNDPLRAASEAGTGFVRRRSPSNVCAEIDELCMSYPETSRLRFTDHAFAADVDWLSGFAAAYEAGCGIPFSCHVRAALFDERRADLLKRAGCVSAEVEVISGSDFVRNDALDMDTSDQQLERTFALLRERGISTLAVNFVGAPYSTPMAEQKTVELNRRVRPDMLEVRVYQPYEGTAARELCQEQGWLSNRPEPGPGLGDSVLDLPQLSPRRIRELAERMADEISGRPQSAWQRIGRWLRGGMLGRLTEGASSMLGRPARATRSRRR